MDIEFILIEWMIKEATIISGVDKMLFFPIYFVVHINCCSCVLISIDHEYSCNFLLLPDYESV